MKNYAIYYSYKGIGDVIIIIFDNDKKPTRSENKGRVTVIYHDEEIIGYNIFNVKEIIKIKSEGMIYLPSNTLIEIINSILANANCPLLALKENSGYFVGQIKEIIPYKNTKIAKILLKEDFFYSELKSDDVSINDKVVVAPSKTFLNNGNCIKEYSLGDYRINSHICSSQELGLLGENILLLDKDINNGEDFFTLEEK